MEMTVDCTLINRGLGFILVSLCRGNASVAIGRAARGEPRPSRSFPQVGQAGKGKADYRAISVRLLP